PSFVRQPLAKDDRPSVAGPRRRSPRGPVANLAIIVIARSSGTACHYSGVPARTALGRETAIGSSQLGENLEAAVRSNKGRSPTRPTKQSQGVEAKTALH